jgi:hypothetical protein
MMQCDETRPTIPMRPPVGSLTACFASGATVEFWFQSPTGDSSDSQIFVMGCTDEVQAETIAAAYRRALHVPKY